MKNIISFYRKAFEQEISKARKLHLFSSQIVKKYFLSGVEELTNEDHPLIPISETKALSFIKDLELNAGSVELKYYSLARITRFTSFSKYEVTRVFPLLEYNAELFEKSGEYYLKIDTTNRKILKTNFDSKIASKLNFEKFQRNKITDFHFVSQLATDLEKNGEQGAEELRLFPELWTSKKINSKIKSKSIDTDLYIPCSVLCLVEKPKFSYSTLGELKQLENEKSYSSAFNAVFNKLKNSHSTEEGIVCEELNESQKEALENSNSKIVSVISGPPGTGKSYTIANLAAEKVSKGQSVLISSKNSEALAVIESKIKDSLSIENLTVNPSDNSNLASLKKYLKYILSREFKVERYQKSNNSIEEYKVNESLRENESIESEIEKQFVIERSAWVNVDTHEFTKNTSNEFKKRIIKARGMHTIPLWHHLEKYYKSLDKNKTYSVDLLQRFSKNSLNFSVQNYRQDLRSYYDFLRARSPERKASLYEKINHDVILKTFPVWLVKMTEVGKVFPLEKEMFDYLIIDEASQCDTASILPLLQRAKKCIVVGDENQLGHISFLAKDFERQLLKSVSIEYKHFCHHRDVSFLKLLNNTIDPQDVTMLHEHYRSKHAIIEFSNQVIYNNELEILTKRPIKGETEVSLVKVAGKNVKSVNLNEINAIVDWMLNLVENEKSLPNNLKTSLGVLSPFRNQVDKLFSLVKRKFTLKQIKEHRIIVGTAFSFQGNERDTMLLSLVLDDDSHSGSFNYVNRKDVFNVSVTRARNKQLVFYSFTQELLKFNSTLQLFFEFYEKYNPWVLESKDLNEFCGEIELFVQRFGFQTWQQFNISGVNIDVLAYKSGKYIAVDLVGFPGDVGDFYKIERYKMLERGGIQLFPLPYAYWLNDKELCLKAIEKLCQD
jgi:superfamily I DNA and/or RNA helicase